MSRPHVGFIVLAWLIPMVAGLSSVAAGEVPSVQALATSPSAPPGPASLVRERATLKGHSDIVWCAAFAPDGKTLATVSGLPVAAGALILWDTVAGKERRRFNQPRGIRSVAFSADGNLIATGDFLAASVTLRDAASGEVRRVLAQGGPSGQAGGSRTITGAAARASGR